MSKRGSWDKVYYLATEMLLKISNIFKHKKDKLSSKMIKEKSIEEISLLGISEHLKKLPSQLAIGQQQMVAIAHALVTNPDIIIADEPTEHLIRKMGKMQ